jgi:hypothetical protein
MIYPKRIDWNGTCSGPTRRPARTGRSQRELAYEPILRSRSRSAEKGEYRQSPRP